MNKLKSPFVILLLLNLLFLTSCSNLSSTKTVYLFRHAEKVLDSTEKNPALTLEGEKQALQISELLKDSKLEEVYSTKYIRNLMTINPLLDSTKAHLNLYEWEAWEQVVDDIQQNKAQVSAVCGHGDILLPMIEHFGGKRPQEKIGDHEYKTIYKLLLQGNQVTVQTIKF
ncbi:Histidine phosphatase superfamily (branch 1) [Lishizhenia tianjinensis]|uniref:Histidine phosphatase superfamily (Branch 1) n=1 Tax=Lishizhenia tianjinensis TaxID=477690 RepID=A0A1I7B9Q0_9FLAO|nr:histidine phosphatase family protein [Lishizhenia tianjinensis]SFT83842.1 Histidine phosphatase superfamily (branch 1) [Lishizhenia tianjinensis]